MAVPKTAIEFITSLSGPILTRHTQPRLLTALRCLPWIGCEIGLWPLIINNQHGEDDIEEDKRIDPGDNYRLRDWLEYYECDGLYDFCCRSGKRGLHTVGNNDAKRGLPLIYTPGSSHWHHDTAPRFVGPGLRQSVWQTNGTLDSGWQDWTMVCWRTGCGMVGIMPYILALGCLRTRSSNLTRGVYYLRNLSISKWAYRQDILQDLKYLDLGMVSLTVHKSYREIQIPQSLY